MCNKLYNREYLHVEIHEADIFFLQFPVGKKERKGDVSRGVVRKKSVVKVEKKGCAFGTTGTNLSTSCFIPRSCCAIKESRYLIFFFFLILDSV